KVPGQGRFMPARYFATTNAGGGHSPPPQKALGPREKRRPPHMFATKRFISRRTILRGMGAGIALPFLEAMVPAFTPTARTAANPLKRFGAVFVPLGERPGYWTPTKVGGDFEFTPILKSLEPVRD